MHSGHAHGHSFSDGSRNSARHHLMTTMASFSLAIIAATGYAASSSAPGSTALSSTISSTGQTSTASQAIAMLPKSDKRASIEIDDDQTSK